MAETRVTLCDSCKNVVAMTTCEVCGKDLCKGCTYSIKYFKPAPWQESALVQQSYMIFIMCAKCEKIAQEFPDKEWKEIKELVLTKFKAKVMLKTIEKEEKKI